MKKIIINADDFGYLPDNNDAIKQGFLSGVITSASILTNLQGFDDAVNNTLKEIPDMDLGFHFNITEGKSLTNCNLLCDNNGYFNNSYTDLILKSNNQKFIEQVEKEFRAQIDKILKYHLITHMDSHMHIHAIPKIFKLFIKLAQEYNIKFIRTQKEIPYIIWSKSLNLRYPINIIKNILLNSYTTINNKELSDTIIKTNDYFIGVLYTGNMDESTILQGIKKINKTNSITEVIFHPTINKNKQKNYKEFLTAQNLKIKDLILNSGFELTNYSKLIY